MSVTQPDLRIACPNCDHSFALTEQFAGPLLAEQRAEADRAREAALAAQKAQIEAAALQAAKSAQAEELARTKAQAEAARADLAEQLAALKAQTDVQQTQLAEARKVQAAAVEKERALKAREEELEVTLQTRLTQELKAQEARALAQAEARTAEKLTAAQEEAQIKLAERDQQMETLKRQIEVLKQKSEKGSQQLQGEAAEVALEDRLSGAFVLDTITPVEKGMRGADCVQTVSGPFGTAGTILWESKRTQNWSPGWLAKLRDDQRLIGADIAVISSSVRPDGVDTFELIDGVWVCAPAFAVPLAAVLRQSLMEVATARGAREGQATKTELLYDYLTGPGFRQRVEAIVENFEKMQADLNKERTAMQRIWAAREKQIVAVIDATSGMYGDIQGIAGASLPTIAALELPGD